MDRRRPETDEVVVEVVGVARRTGPGVGISGIVVERGAGACFADGDEVFGAIPAADGRLVVCPCGALASKPAGLAHAEAAVLAAVGPAALAAVQRAGARAGDRVMITGAGDDAGAIAVQIAKARLSHVTAVCRERDVPSVWDLGADEVLARGREAGDRARFVAVIDTDRSVTPELAARLLAPGGRLVALQDATPDEIGPRELVVLVERDRVFPVLGERSDIVGT
jgi:NADPH:quinone reductase-like Zn-dependent oxidoreductase